MASHFPSGHRSVAMRSFAQVLQPHFRQRPVLFKAAASHSGQTLQMSCRTVSVSGGVAAKPETINLPAASASIFILIFAISNFSSFMDIEILLLCFQRMGHQKCLYMFQTDYRNKDLRHMMLLPHRQHLLKSKSSNSSHIPSMQKP